jgi:phosphoribosylaminoimidazole carboxylase (NCAIR synthetase)
MPSIRHTEFAPFVLDLLDFMEEKLREAIADEACQAGAVSEAAGVLPLLRDRLREKEDIQASFILVFSDYLYSPHAADWWTAFARMDRPAFEKEAEALLGLLPVLRQVAAGAP